MQWPNPANDGPGYPCRAHRDDPVNAGDHPVR